MPLGSGVAGALEQPPVTVPGWAAPQPAWGWGGGSRSQCPFRAQFQGALPRLREWVKHCYACCTKKKTEGASTNARHGHSSASAALAQLPRNLWREPGKPRGAQSAASTLFQGTHTRVPCPFWGQRSV